MLAGLKRRLKDMSTLRQVFESAESLARAEGAAEPGSEHLVMAALDLPDDTARRAFRRVAADPARFAPAVMQQFADALKQVGVDVGTLLISPEALPGPTGTGLYRSKPSAQALMKRLAKDRPPRSQKPLLGADIVLAALASDTGAVARALAVMGVEPGQLTDACQLEIDAWGCAT